MFPQTATKPQKGRQGMTPNSSKARQRRQRQQRLEQWLAADKESEATV